MATDALIGTFARTDDPSLIQNVCFLYHLIGGGTGDWDVPIGGMGAVSGALAAAAAGHGAEIVTGAEVYAITPDGEVRYRRDGTEHRVHAEFVLANVTPAVLAGLLGEPEPTLAPGAQVKVNLMLRRLPRLRDDTVTPEQAFGGTFHINETFSQLDTAYTRADHGVVPDPLPCEIYCHSLTDPTILSEELRASGAQTLTVFGLHTPHRLVAGADPDRMRDTLTSAVLNSLNSVLAEPIQDVLMEDSAGRLCIETKTTVDLEHALGMTARQHLPRRACRGRSPRTTNRWTRRRAAGVWPPRTIGSCCAGRGPAAAVRCRASAGTTPRWRCWRADSRPGMLCSAPSSSRRACNVAKSLASSAARTSGAGSSIASILRTMSRPASVSDTTLHRRFVGSVSRTTSPRSSRSLTATVAAGASMVAACATCLTVIGCRSSRLRIRILLNGRPVCSTTARFQLSRLSITSAAIARQTSSATDYLTSAASRRTSVRRSAERAARPSAAPAPTSSRCRGR